MVIHIFIYNFRCYETTLGNLVTGKRNKLLKLRSISAFQCMLTVIKPYVIKFASFPAIGTLDKLLSTLGPGQDSQSQDWVREGPEGSGTYF